MANSEVQELIVKISAENAELKKKLQDSGKDVTGFQKQIMDLGKSIAGAFAVREVLRFASESYKAFEEQEKANRRLLFALNNNQGAYKELTRQANELQATTGVSDDSIMQIQMLAVQSGKTIDQVKKLTTASLNLSAATGRDLQSSYMELSKTYNGQLGRTLTAMGTDFTNLTKAQLESGAAIDQVNKKMGQLAEQSATSSELMAANWEEFKESFGGAVSGVVNPLLDMMTEKLQNVNKVSGFWNKLAVAIDITGESTQLLNDADREAYEQAQKDAKIQAAANAWVQSDAGKKAIDLKTQEILKEMGFGKAAEQTAEQLKAQNKALEDQKKLWDEITSAQIRNAQAEGDKQMNSLNSQAAGWMLGDMGKMQPKGAKATGTLDATKLAKLTSGMKDLKTETSAVASEMREMAMAMASGETAASSFLSIINEGTTNLEDMGKSIYNSARSAIAAEMAQGIAATLRSVLVGVPFPLNLILAAGAGGAAGALFNNLVPKLAEGGIAYGTTSAIVGEYPGASHNPEVIAPLSKLRDVMGTQKVEVVGYIDGDVIRLANARSSYLRNRRG